MTRSTFFSVSNIVMVIWIICCALYIALLPFLPLVQQAYAQNIGKPVKLDIGNSQAVATATSAENKLIIPGIQLDKNIFDGPDKSQLKNGIWRIPSSSTPDRGGNTVLAGHRFSYKSPAVFYSLPDIKQGQQIMVTYNNKAYIYDVVWTDTVKPNDVRAEEATEKPSLTLYTCTPLWTSSDRFVVRAELNRVIE